jgi:hypothetical protein
MVVATFPAILTPVLNQLFPKFFKKLMTTMHSIKIPQVSLMAIILAIDFGISSLVFNGLFTLDGSKFHFEFGFVLIFSGQLI